MYEMDKNPPHALTNYCYSDIVTIITETSNAAQNKYLN